MGRGGKKKGDKKKEEDVSKAVAGLSLEPSTSGSPPTKEIEEEKRKALKETVTPTKSQPIESKEPSTVRADEDEGGLGLGRGKKIKDKSTDIKKLEEIVSSTTGPKPVEIKKSETASAADDDEEGGLGLGGGKKRRPRKKKLAAQEAQSGEPAKQEVESFVPGPKGDSSGLTQGEPSLGQHAAPHSYTGPPPGYSGAMQDQPHAAQAYRGPPQGHPDAPRSYGSPPPGLSSAPLSHGGPPPGYLSPPQSQWGPPPRQPPGPGRPSAGQSGTPLGHVGLQPGYSEQQPGFGRGAGRGRGAPPSGKAGPPPGYTGPHQVAEPTPSAISHPGRQYIGQQQRAVARPQNIFAIPDKIIGKSVRARPVQVLTNYLPMEIKAIKIHRYDVSFKPDRPKKVLPKAFQASFQKLFPKYLVAFDQIKNFYSVDPLPNVTTTDRLIDNIEILDDNKKTMKFEVSYKGTGVVDLNTILEYMKGGTSLNPPTEAIQCVDVILRQGTLQSYVKSGRNFFKRPSNPIQLGDGLEMWTGLFQSAIFTSRPFVNIDVAHKGFPIQQPVIKLLNTFRLDINTPLERQNRYNLENFTSFLKGLKVMARIGGETNVTREFICNGIGQPASRQKFTMTDSAGKQIEMTVADYFKQKCCRLQFPHLNVLWVGPRDKNIYYPMELLEVSYGQVSNKQLNETQLSTMVRTAATPPDDRKRKIHEVIADMNYSKNVYFKKFGLQISEQFMQVEAKVLHPPKLRHGDKVVEPRNGQWMANRMLQGATLSLWGFIAIDLDQHGSNSEYTIDMMKSCGRSMGITVDNPMLQRYNVNTRDLEAVMNEALKAKLQLLFVAIPTRGRDVYSQVKKVAELNVGMLTQCLKEQTAARRMNQQTARNILLKVNSKLMGVNQVLDASTLPNCLRGGGVMVVGADVTHPSPDQTSIPSIAAVTASIDTNCFQYNIGLSIQTPKKEMIVEFEDIMVEHLQEYRKRQRALPKKIFVFRDGVSEGQFAEVMNSELQAVYNAYQRLSGTMEKPQVLFQLVQKRHHTRMFQTANASQNVEPGTVVDTQIVHVRELDFYLVSHQAIKGTARPTRYHAVCNDGRMPHDEVEQLTYYLCHLYSRCLRSVSYPTPTYYAHLACLRARVLTLGNKYDNAELEKQPVRLRVFDRIVKTSPMFFV